MNLFILNQKFENVYVMNEFESFIWTDRYYAAGDFELCISPTDAAMEYVQFGNYLWFSESEHLMIIEYIETRSDAEEGDTVYIKGKSLEYILFRRIVWGERILNTTLQNGIKTLINEAIISPSVAARKIDNFVFKETDNERINSITMDTQYTGDNLYEIIQSLCEEHGVGFRILLDEETFNFVFELYDGTDRSYDQITVPQVAFSRSYSNINESEYIENREEYKNVTLIGGEGEGAARYYTTRGNVEGLERREIFTNAAHVRSEDVSASQYEAALQEEGQKTLKDNKIQQAFDGDIDYSRPFKFGVDFFVGDIVEAEDNYGMRGTFRIIEYMWSYNKNEVSCYPTFESLFESEEEQEGE